MMRSIVAMLALLASTLAGAQAFPSKPVKMLVGFPPGGGLDFTTRLISQHMAEGLGQPVVVENRPGAAGVQALGEVARATPDGYTLIVGNVGPMALAPNMMAQRPYDPVRDFTAIGQVVVTYFIATVPANHPANSMREFLDWARKSDGKGNFASGGNGSITHLNGELLNQVGGVKLAHVPYKGTAPAMTDLIAGQTHYLCDILSVLGPQVAAGKLKALAVTGPQRDAAFPNVPTMREAGYPGLDTAGWQGLVGPAGMPKDVVARIATELKRALAKPEVRERFAKAGTPVLERGPEEFAQFIRAENERWLPIIKASGAKIE